MRNHFLRAAAGNVVGVTPYFTYTDSASSTVGNSTYTFSAMAIGSADAARWVVACLGYTDNSSSTVLDSVTIGGVSAEIIIQRSNGSSTQRGCAIAVANVPSGTTATVVATFSAAFSSCSCYVGVFYGEYIPQYIYSDSAPTPGALSPWTTGTTATTSGIDSFYLVNYLVGTGFGTPGAWTGVTSLAEATYATNIVHAIASKDPSTFADVTWERTITAYSNGGASTAVAFVQLSQFSTALATSITNFNAGNPSTNVSAINETVPDTSTWIADTNNNTATISFGTLGIASSGFCRLEFYATVYNQQLGIENNNGNTGYSMGNATLNGYTIFSSLVPSTTWAKYTYDFDASNITSGSTTFSWTNVRAGATGNRTGPAIGWIRFIYTPS